MLFSSKTLVRNLVGAGLISANALVSVHVFAQQTAPANVTPPQPAVIQKVEKIEVTGSNLKRVDAETSSPITIINAVDIKRSGATSVQELLSNLPIAVGGALNDISAGNGFSAGAATVALRGLGSQATLTLLNGRRISPAAFNDPNTGQSVITNLNSIPTAAIERIEILRDGASAIYGSDAIAGVVNIILRKDFTGAVGTASISQNADNEFRIKQVNAAFGFGDLAADKFNVFGTYERFEREAVLIKQEDNVDNNWTNATFLQRQSVLSSLSYPGNYYREARLGSGLFATFVAARTGCPTVIGGLCRYNQWDDLEQSGKTLRDTAYVRGTIDIRANLSAFGEASFSKTVNTFTGAPITDNPATPTIWLTNSFQPLRFQLVLPVGHPENPYAFPVGLRYRWVDLGRSRDISTTKDTRAVAGLKGSFGTWDWESALLFNTSKAETTTGRRLLFPEVQQAIADGSWKFNAPNSQAQIDRISTNFTNKGESTSKIWDLKTSTEFGQLPGGAIAVGAGIELRRDSLEISPDANVVNSRIVGLGASFADGSRKVTSGFVEFALPLTKTLDASVAGRYDKYSDYGSSTNPKFGLKWKALPNLALRTNYSTGFRAPSLSQISKSAVRSFQQITDNLRCPVTADPDECGGLKVVAAQIQFNPNLEPEKSKSYNFGAIWDVTKSLSLSLDYFNIARKNEIDRFSSNFVVQGNFNGEARFANSVLRDPNPLTWLPGVPNSGPVQTVLRQYLNLGGSQVTGVDIDVTQNINLSELGKLTLNATATYNINNKFAREKDDPLVDSIGGVNSPRIRGNISGNWDYRDWSFGVRGNYVGRYNYRDGFGTCLTYAGQARIDSISGLCQIKSWATMDANVSYNGIKDLTLRLVVRNITDKKPPFDFNANTTLGYNTSFHNPLGIYPTLSASYKFK
jgi:iron complex outermembrane recepter protein